VPTDTGVVSLDNYCYARDRGTGSDIVHADNVDDDERPGEESCLYIVRNE